MENPKSRAWKVVKSEYLARKPWFTVRHERIELPDGRSIPDYYVFEYPDWVNVIAITKEGKFVFIDQYRHGLGETNYEIPAGVVRLRLKRMKQKLLPISHPAIPVQRRQRQNPTDPVLPVAVRVSRSIHIPG